MKRELRNWRRKVGEKRGYRKKKGKNMLSYVEERRRRRTRNGKKE